MRHKAYPLCLLSVFLIVWTAGCCAAAQQRRARPGSFVRYCVYSPSDLAEQIKSDPVVAKRYASHFGTTPEKVIEYFTTNLTPTTLRKPTKARTYFIGKGGKIVSKIKVLKAGTPVLVAHDGTLIMESECGNPLTTRLPPKAEAKAWTGVVEAPAASEAAPMAAEPEPLELAEQPAVVAMAPEAILTPAVSSPAVLGLAKALAPLLGLVAVRSSKDTTPVIPEPSSLAALGIPTLGFAALSWRKHRSAWR